MYKDKKVAVVLPAYNAEKTLRRTISEIPSELDISEHPVQPMPGQCGGERAQARV